MYSQLENIFKIDGDDTLWWDGYQGQKILLIDDFYGTIKYGKLLNILDIYPLRLPTKGGHTYANWEKIYITSNDKPDKWYQKGLTPALERRLNTIIDLASEVTGNTASHEKEITIVSKNLLKCKILDENIDEINE